MGPTEVVGAALPLRAPFWVEKSPKRRCGVTPHPHTQRHPTTLTTPEHTVELRGAAIAWASKEKSSKKHVLEVSGGTARGRGSAYGATPHPDHPTPS